MIALMMLAAMVSPDPRCSARISFVQPAKGAISTSAMAATIGEVYLTAVYGADVIGRELPLSVSRANEVWHVNGTAHVRPFHRYIGGLAEIDLCQSNGLVLRIFHGK